MDKFEIEIVNYLDKDLPVAEIYYDGVQWAQISSKNQKIIVQFYSPPDNNNWEFSFESSIRILNKAKDKFLKKFNKEHSLFSPISTDPKKVNQQAELLLEEIIQNPQSTVYINRFNGKDVFNPSGKGARFDQEGNFMGFLQSRNNG